MSYKLEIKVSKLTNLEIEKLVYIDGHVMEMENSYVSIENADIPEFLAKLYAALGIVPPK